MTCTTVYILKLINKKVPSLAKYTKISAAKKYFQICAKYEYFYIMSMNNHAHHEQPILLSSLKLIGVMFFWFHHVYNIHIGETAYYMCNYTTRGGTSKEVIAKLNI